VAAFADVRRTFYAAIDRGYVPATPSRASGMLAAERNSRRCESSRRMVDVAAAQTKWRVA
jgi:hypothetical protein